MRVLAPAPVLLLIAASMAAGQQHPLFFWTMQQREIESLVRHVPQDDNVRLAQLKQTFKDMQCGGDDLQEQAFAGGRNLLCSVHGSSHDTILFVAHYEHDGAGLSAIDNWTGAMMLPFLYHALMAAPRKHNFLFLEVDGEAGVRSYLRSLPAAQLHGLSAVVAVDALGLGAPSYYLRTNGSLASPTESTLRSTLLLAAEEDGLPAPRQEIPGGWLKTDDTKQFRFKGVPSILIHSVNRETRDIPGSAKDTGDAINAEVYFTSYRMLCYYVAELDDTSIGAQADGASSTPSRGRR